MPAPMATAWVSCHWVRLMGSVVRATWGSPAWPPRPGKCLTVEPTPPSCRPSTAAATSGATTAAVEPKARSPMTPSAGLVRMSLTGARSSPTPRERSPRAVAAIAERTAPGPPAPSTSSLGIAGTPSETAEARPPSWLRQTRSGAGSPASLPRAPSSAVRWRRPPAPAKLPGRSTTVPTLRSTIRWRSAGVTSRPEKATPTVWPSAMVRSSASGLAAAPGAAAELVEVAREVARAAGEEPQAEASRARQRIPPPRGRRPRATGRPATAGQSRESPPSAGFAARIPRRASRTLVRAPVGRAPITMSRETRAHHPATGPQGPVAHRQEDQGAGPQGVASAPWRLRARLHHDPQEAELGPPQGGSHPADEQGRGDRLHPRDRAQSPGALGGAGARRPREGPARRPVPRHPWNPGHRRHPQPQAGP